MRSGCVSLNNCYSVSGAFGCENWVEGAFGCGAQYRTYRTSKKFKIHSLDRETNLIVLSIEATIFGK